MISILYQILTLSVQCIGRIFIPRFRSSDIWEFTIPAGGVVMNEKRATTYTHLLGDFHGMCGSVSFYYDVYKCKLLSFCSSGYLVTCYLCVIT